MKGLILLNFELTNLENNSFKLSLLNIWNKQTLPLNIKELEKENFLKDSKIIVDFQNLKECDNSAIIYLISFFKKFDEKNISLINLNSYEKIYRFYEKHYHDEILALTFTDKAAKEMQERVDILMPYGYTDIWISTFHAFGDRILRGNA